MMGQIRTTNHIQRKQCNVLSDVDGLVGWYLCQFLYQNVALTVHYFNKIVQDFEMKGGCQGFSSYEPLLTVTGDKALS